MLFPCYTLDITSAKEMRHFHSLLCLSLSVSILLTACDSESPVAVQSTPVFSTSELAGGQTTVFDASSHAFSIPAPNLSPAAFEKHLEGDVEFEARVCHSTRGRKSGGWDRSTTTCPVSTAIPVMDAGVHRGATKDLSHYFSDSVFQKQKIHWMESPLFLYQGSVRNSTTGQLSTQVLKVKSKLTILSRH